MIIVPQHIKNYIARVEKELKQRYKDTGKKCIKKAVKTVKLARQELESIEVSCLCNEDTSLRVFELLNTINNQCQHLIYPGLGRVHCEVDIEPDLVLSLNRALSESTGVLRDEAEELARFLIQDTPNAAWAQVDEVAGYRIFKLVKSAKKISYILKKYENSKWEMVYNITGSFKKIKLVVVKSETTLTKKINLLGFEDIHEYDRMLGDKYKDVVKKWLKVGRVCTYYIYVPEK